MTYTVKAVADLAGVTVRTLHHYDRIGLLLPESVSYAGYRLYSDADLERLQQILFFRELGFPLREIGEIVNSPDFDRREALLDHRRLLEQRRERLEGLIAVVDRTLENLDGEDNMDKRGLFAAFDDPQQEEYRREARARWGKKVDDSYEGLAKLSDAERAAAWEQAQAINLGLADLVGRDPADPEVQEMIGRWYTLLNRHFWTCSPDAFKNLGEMYVQDERFTAFYENIRPGLAVFMRDAMRIYGDKAQ